MVSTRSRGQKVFNVCNIIALILLAVLLFLLFRPDPYKNQKVYSRRSVQE